MVSVPMITCGEVVQERKQEEGNNTLRYKGEGLTIKRRLDDSREDAIVTRSTSGNHRNHTHHKGVKLVVHTLYCPCDAYPVLGALHGGGERKRV